MSKLLALTITLMLSSNVLADTVDCGPSRKYGNCMYLINVTRLSQDVSPGIYQFHYDGVRYIFSINNCVIGFTSENT